MNIPNHPAFRILLVDDEPAWLKSLSLTLRSLAGFTNIQTCQDSREVLPLLAEGGIGLIILDLTMPHHTGEQLLEVIGERHPDILVIVLSGLNQLETAVRCMKLGAFDYFVKTDDQDRIMGGILRAVRMQEMRREYREIADRFVDGTLRHPEVFADIVTGDRAMLAVFAYVEAVSASPQPLLITGESGVGKELIAQAAHRLSGCTGKLVAVNVAGLDDAVFTDTLFGHTRGAFTGADQARRGMVEEATEGVLFLDEIGDLGVTAQVKLLRLLQEGEYYPLGSDLAKRLRARVIVATHQDLVAREAEGIFRRDLYYRLHTHHIHVPPLRQRPGDIPLLLNHFLDEAARELGKKKPPAPRELVRLLMAYDFPGNVRELRAMVYDAVSTMRSRQLTPEAFVRAMQHRNGKPTRSPNAAPPRNPFAGFAELPTFGEAAGFLVMEAMERAGGHQTIAARLLGISQPALSKRLKLLRTDAP